MPTIIVSAAADNRSAALSLAEQGLAVLPITPGRKGPPLIAGGYKGASDDPRTVARWWSKWPNANIALATGERNGLAVVDVDWRNGAEPEDLPTGWNRTLTVATPNGAHLYYQHEGPLRTISELDGIGIKGDGGYVVAPPSRRPDGCYEWFKSLAPLVLPPGLVERFGPAMVLETLPDQVRAQVRRERERGPIPVRYPRQWADKALREQADYVRRASCHRNNQLLISGITMGQIIAIGWLRLETVVASLTEAALAVGLGPSEIRPTIMSGISRGQRFPRQILVQGKGA